jgi:hypothetical protein
MLTLAATLPLTLLPPVANVLLTSRKSCKFTAGVIDDTMPASVNNHGGHKLHKNLITLNCTF